MRAGTQEYNTLHKWVQQYVAVDSKCQECSGTRALQRANVSGEYRRDPTDYITLCAKCHHIYDNLSAKLRTKSKKFWEQREMCRNGHKLKKVGFYESTTNGRTSRICKECHRINKMTYRHNLKKGTR